MLTISNKKDQVVLEDRKVTERVKLSNLENCVIRNVDFSSNEADHMVNATDLKNCQFIKCKFHGKSSKGVAMNMSGSKTQGNVFDGCEWYDLTYSAGNGGEPLRLGNSQYSGCLFNCTVRNCYFHDLAADPETISIKSCGNIVENCKHENNKSSFVIRHGGFATIRNNEFIGEGGIRIYGYGNKVTGNTFRDNKSDKYPPITLGAGTKDKDPNFDAPDRPSGKEGSSHATYAQINNNIIKDNLFINCKTKIKTRTDHPLKAIKSDISDTAPATPPPVTPTPTEPGPVTPPTPPPPQPEPSGPVEPPLPPPVVEEPPTTTTGPVKLKIVGLEQVISGSKKFQVEASDPARVDKIEIFIDKEGSKDHSAAKTQKVVPYDFRLNSTKFKNGWHRLIALATTKEGKTYKKSQWIKIKN